MIALFITYLVGFAFFGFCAASLEPEPKNGRYWPIWFRTVAFAAAWPVLVVVGVFFLFAEVIA
jgi:hypothetical protein